MWLAAGEAVVPLEELDQLPLVIVVPAGLAIAALSFLAYMVKKRR